MQVSETCPVCGSGEIKPVFDPVLILVRRDDVPIVAYRCHNAHLFLPPDQRYEP